MWDSNPKTLVLNSDPQQQRLLGPESFPPLPILPFLGRLESPWSKSLHVRVLCNSGGPDPVPVEKWKNLQFDTGAAGKLEREQQYCLFLMEHDLCSVQLWSLKKRKLSQVLSCCFPCCDVLFCTWIIPQLQQELPSCVPAGGNGAPSPAELSWMQLQTRGIPCGMKNIVFTLDIGDTKLAGPTAAFLSFQTPHKSSATTPPSMLEHLWLCSRWQCSTARCQDEPVHFSIICILPWSSRKRGEKKKTPNHPLGSWSVQGYLLLWGSQQYEHIDPNNSGISKWRSPETAGPYWHGGHSPEDNLWSLLKFQAQIPKQLRFSCAFPTGGAENVPLAQHWNGTFSWHSTFPLPLSSRRVSALPWLLGTRCCGIKNSSL